MEGGVVESEAKKWVIAGIPLRTPLKPISTNPAPFDDKDRELIEDEEEEECSISTTPTAQESRIPERLTCPAAPRKRKPPSSSSRCHFNGVREFFTPPDHFETVFIRVSSKSA